MKDLIQANEMKEKIVGRPAAHPACMRGGKLGSTEMKKLGLKPLSVMTLNKMFATAPNKEDLTPECWKTWHALKTLSVESVIRKTEE